MKYLQVSILTGAYKRLFLFIREFQINYIDIQNIKDMIFIKVRRLWKHENFLFNGIVRLKKLFQKTFVNFRRI